MLTTDCHPGHRVCSLWWEICVSAIARQAQTPDFLSHPWFKALKKKKKKKLLFSMRYFKVMNKLREFSQKGK